MVSPIIFIAAALILAFLYPLIERVGRGPALAVALAAPAAAAAVSLSWTVALLAGGEPIIAHTAGFEAPLSINLHVGATEAVVLFVVNIVAVLAIAALTLRREQPWRGKQIALYFVLLLGSYGLVMTNDLFNMFVFMEISGISVFGLLSTSRDGRVYEAGFKYIVAAGLASGFFLIGTAFIYRLTGSLDLTALVAAAGELSGTAGVLALVFLLSGVLIELKPAPANGWALDVYQSADHGIGALLSAVNATAMVVVLSRLLPVFTGAASGVFLPLLMVAGAAAYLLPQIQALMQTSFKRLLGYSSVAQVGLVVLALAVEAEPVNLAVATLPVAVVLLLNHALAKAGLFWLAEALGDDATGLGDAVPASRRGRAAVLVPAGLFVLALLGLPPFPAFWAKWNLVMGLGAAGSHTVLAVVLAGSLLEAVYLFRWYIALARRPGDTADVLAEQVPDDGLDTGSGATAAADTETEGRPGTARTPIPARGVASASVPRRVGAPSAAPAGFVLPWAAAFAIAAASILPLAGFAVPFAVWLVPAAVLAFGLLDALGVPVRAQAVPAAALLALYLWLRIWPLSGMTQLFGLLFGVGGAIQLVALLGRRGRAPGLVAMTAGMLLALLALVLVDTPIGLFLAWEFMALTSFFLVARGAWAQAAAHRYILFSLLSAFLLLAGLALPGGAAVLAGFTGAAGAGAIAGGTAGAGTAVAVLVVLAVLVKLGAVGFHVWLPPAYAEAEDEVTALISSVLSKAGVFLLFAGAGAVAVPLFPGLTLPAVLGWIGVATALAGALMAIFQEDAKYLLAYSSMSQIGYIVLSFAVLSHLGWLSGLYLAVTHLLFKAILFLALAGVFVRTGTRLMYRMGGLITRMPVSFAATLIGIIALSGVPPLSGFGGKWLLYTALIEKGWYLQAALALFASGVAFLYLFRLIHSVFLGQMKPDHREVREAPPALLVPQLVFVAAIMAVSMFPNLLIGPLQTVIEPAFGATVSWNGFAVISSLGYWNGNVVMYVTMGVFILPLLWLLLVKGRTYKVRQFNIVYAAERPATPETTHYAFNFSAHYRKALGCLAEPWITRLWTGAAEAGSTVSNALRAWNTGNPQTYAFQIVLYLFLVFLFTAGGV